MARGGVEPPACLGLNETGLPIAYRAISPNSTWSGSRTHNHLGLGQVARPIGVSRQPLTRTRPFLDSPPFPRLGEKGSNLHLTASKTADLPLVDPRNDPGGRRGSRTLKTYVRPFSRRLPSPIGSPFHTRVGQVGFEPTCPSIRNWWMKPLSYCPS